VNGSEPRLDERVLPRSARDAPRLIAVSGGADSAVLLELAAAQVVRPPLRAIHIDHALQPAAAAFAASARRQCARLGIELLQVRVQVDARHPQGLEAAARAARYAAFAAAMQPGEVLMTAHHQDDQAETFLLRALRGSGVAGLAAIAPWQRFGPGHLWRPLLAASRALLRAYAQAQGLAWVEDPHNGDPRFDRAWLRSELWPRLQQRWPQAAAELARAASRAAEAASLLDERAAADLAGLRRGEALSVSALRALPAARRRLALQHWLAVERGLPQAPRAALERAGPELLDAAADREPCIRWRGGCLLRYRDLIVATPPLPAPPPAGWRVQWRPLQSAEPELLLPEGCGRLRWRGALPDEIFVLRFAHGGEVFKPPGSQHRRRLKQLFQERGVPPWIRRRTPLLFAGERLIWAGGLGSDADSPLPPDALVWECALLPLLHLP
jgi:tRNA(Ile)-lysidine synthase